MTPFLSPSQSRQLQKIAKRNKKGVKLGKPWNQWTDDNLWRKVLGQIAVVGRAGPGERLQHDPKIKKLVSIQKLKRLRSNAQLQKYLHDVFVKVKVRFVGRNWKTDKKAKAGMKNFRTVMAAGGPKEFFQKIDDKKREKERIEALKKSLEYFGNKGARDTAIELRLADDCVALDTRIYAVLEMVGVKASPDDIYEQIEKELVEKVATPIGISGALLDRILFKKYNQIMSSR